MKKSYPRKHPGVQGLKGRDTWNSIKKTNKGEETKWFTEKKNPKTFGGKPTAAKNIPLGKEEKDKKVVGNLGSTTRDFRIRSNKKNRGVLVPT